MFRAKKRGLVIGIRENYILVSISLLDYSLNI